MGLHSAQSGKRLTGGVLAGALATGALAGAGLGSAPHANATCAALFGIGNTKQCSSTPTTIAIALGNGATATAGGIFGVAFSIGDGASAATGADIASTPQSSGFAVAVALGTGTQAASYGLFSTAIATSGYGAGGVRAESGGNFTFSINVSGPTANGHISQTQAFGQGSTAVNLFGTAQGFSNVISADGLGALSANILGDGNVVEAEKGPLSIAASLFQSGQNSGQDVNAVNQTGPGFNINNRITLPLQTPQKKKKTAAAAASATKPSRATGGSGRAGSPDKD